MKISKRNELQHITPVIADAFRAAMRIRPHRERQIHDGKACPGIGDCEVCDTYEAHVATIATGLALKPHERHPVDVAADVDAPPWFTAEQQADWETARALYVELCQAAGVKPARRIELRDICRAHENVRWAERHCRIPEGRDIGTPARLREFQREAMRAIYNNGDPAAAALAKAPGGA